MRKGHASATALLIAAARSLASHTRAAAVDPQDRLAEHLLPRPLSLGLRALHSTPLASVIAPLAVKASFGLVDHVALRTAMIDRALVDAARADIRQLVILGAGLDTRAHRLPTLRESTVYEVDHPDSQRQKREHSADLPVLCSALHYVAADLTEATLAARLEAAGHRQDAPTSWLAEGLVPYLPRPALQRMLAVIASRSTAGSRFAITYVTPDHISAGALVRRALALIGEPLRTPLTPADMAQLLAAAGFAVQEDSDTRDWAAALSPQRKPLLTYERLVLATKV